jgi:hypothetical protein
MLHGLHIILHFVDPSNIRRYVLSSVLLFLPVSRICSTTLDQFKALASFPSYKVKLVLPSVINRLHHVEGTKPPGCQLFDLR